MATRERERERVSTFLFAVEVEAHTNGNSFKIDGCNCEVISIASNTNTSAQVNYQPYPQPNAIQSGSMYAYTASLHRVRTVRPTKNLPPPYMAPFSSRMFSNREYHTGSTSDTNLARRSSYMRHTMQSTSGVITLVLQAIQQDVQCCPWHTPAGSTCRADRQLLRQSHRTPHLMP
jgi:hypothetical protein